MATLDRISQLKAAYVEKAETLTDNIGRLEVLTYIDDWEQLKRAERSLAAGSAVTSYSINGRSVTRADLRNVRFERERLEELIRDCLGISGGVVQADLREAFA